MLAHRRVAGTALLVLAVAAPAIAQQPQQEDRLTWETNLEAAQRRAAETNRLVLIHLGGPWCQHCVKLEREVFSQPGFGRELMSDYVAVKLDLPQHKAVAAQYGVDKVPTDVITTAQGQLIVKMNSPRTVAAYVAAMRQVAVDARAKRPIDLPAGGPGQRRPDAGDRYASQAPRGDSEPATSGDRYASAPAYEGHAPASSHREGQGEPSPLHGGRPFAETADELPQLPAGSPPLALEGFCPVTLCEKKTWAAGDVRWGAIHRRRTFLFAGEAEQKAFLADPDRYAPVLDGNDPVLALERSQAVRGSRDHGMFHYGRVYLFASEETLSAFCKNPERYAVDVRQARRPKR